MVEWCGVVVCWVVRDGGVVGVIRVVGWVVDIRYSIHRLEIRSNPKDPCCCAVVVRKGRGVLCEEGEAGGGFL